MLGLARRLAAASAQADWTALETLNQELAGSLPLLAAQGGWNDAEQTVLLQLRKIFAQAVKICSEEKDRLEKHLGSLQANKEGWIAYALNGAIDADGIQA
ncbi:hypothetical protein GJA_1923 [Janthinobacterium agaricidamnosum NBRC 102515 = DSM 9628]|uniref:Flagellar FliT family protein n=1 Tax=Janthinobacterium agaricidamnosum NBRC 102515 = DSM 9628 TaxID=1349767 RepID=W0V162_9BURK|nr:hypothetical protein GJA_1923 [Janthinobacterium agaricidamnosum NBRC 102515 = DSM 9628]